MTMYQMGQKAPSDDNEVLRSKLDTDLAAEMKYATYGIQSVLKGIEPIQGKEYYVLEHTMPAGLKSTDYFDVATGLRYKTVDTSEKDGVVSVTEVVYIEYMTTKAKVMFPKVAKFNADGQSFDMVTNELVINAKIDAALFEAK
jgi:hypothetical protein